MREPFNGLSHLVGAVAALAGSVLLLIFAGNGTAKLLSLLVYGLCLVGLFSASAAYHLAIVPPESLMVLRKLDHSAIYLLIAGTYTPFCINALTGFFHWGLLIIIWAIALAGILIKVFSMETPRWLDAAVYVAMGWLCLSAGEQMSTVLSRPSLVWLIAGGVIYTLGALIYALKLFNFSAGRFGFHEVWHIFVLLGAGAHFIAVLILIEHPV